MKSIEFIHLNDICRVMTYHENVSLERKIFFILCMGSAYEYLI